MNHYVCTGGCDEVSDNQGVCQNKNCLKNGQPLHKCDCSDKTHHGLITICQKCGTLCRTKGGCEVESFKSELGSGE